MGPPSYRRSIVDRNFLMRRMTNAPSQHELNCTECCLRQKKTDTPVSILTGSSPSVSRSGVSIRHISVRTAYVSSISVFKLTLCQNDAYVWPYQLAGGNNCNTPCRLSWATAGSRGPRNFQNIKICCRCFGTGFRRSDRRQHSGSL
jgi:hypothetical protein